jgi:polar amino acid transport system permease protein
MGPSFDVGLLLRGEAHDWLLQGLRVSLTLTAVCLVLALPLSLAVALLRLSPFAVLRALGATYVEVMRGVPLLAHLLFWYFGAPALLPDAWQAWLSEHDLEFWSAAAALTLYIAAYMAEDVRSGIRAVPTVQLEAARALGFSLWASLRKVVLPQALRAAVPPLLLQTLNLWKDSSLATVIGLGELMYQAARVESATFRSAEAFAFVTVAYLAVSLALTGLAAWAQQRGLSRGAEHAL